MAAPVSTRATLRSATRFLSPQLIRFGLVGLSGILVNQLVFSSFVELGGLAYVLAAVVAALSPLAGDFAAAR